MFEICSGLVTSTALNSTARDFLKGSMFTHLHSTNTVEFFAVDVSHIRGETGAPRDSDKPAAFWCCHRKIRAVICHPKRLLVIQTRTCLKIIQDTISCLYTVRFFHVQSLWSEDWRICKITKQHFLEGSKCSRLKHAYVYPNKFKTLWDHDD